jgi:threonyl-tRNA synthetase
MRWSQYFIPTLREDPADAEVVSHKLLLRAGIIRQLSAGIYSYLPLGQRIALKVMQIVREEMNRIGGQEFYLPALHPAELWQESGRWSAIGDDMFRLKDRKGADMCLGMTHEEVMTEIARKELRSYKQLPQIWYQIQTKFRDEPRPKSGLLRVRQLTMDDAHIFCRPDQVQDEIRGVLEFQKAIYSVFGMEPRYYLSTRPEKAIGDPAVWDVAEADLRAALELNGLEYEVKAGEGAFYGPKIDVDIQDALGRPWQLNTTQLDFQMPERFKLEYVGEDGQGHRPVMIHRAIFGTYERFMAVLIEHYAGAFPVWLAPVQAVIVPIADRHLEYAETVSGTLRAGGFRVEVDSRREKMQAKIRDAQAQQVPYMLVVGDRDQQAGTVSVRERRQGDLGAQPLADFLKLLEDQRAART